MTLQNKIGGWHRARFPYANPNVVILRAMSELGELADALNAMAPDDVTNGTAGNPAEEAADVVIAMMVFVDRWYWKTDLLELVENKLAKLVDVHSGHRSALRKDQAVPTDQGDVIST